MQVLYQVRSNSFPNRMFSFIEVFYSQWFCATCAKVPPTYHLSPPPPFCCASMSSGQDSNELSISFMMAFSNAVLPLPIFPTIKISCPLATCNLFMRKQKDYRLGYSYCNQLSSSVFSSLISRFGQLKAIPLISKQIGYVHCSKSELLLKLL